MLRGRRPFVVALLLVITACAGDGNAPSDAAPAPTAGEPSVQQSSEPPTAGSPTPVVTAGAETVDLPVVALRSSGALELRSVSRATRAAELVRTLAPPQDDASVVDVAMAEGADPLVCATWHTGPGELYDDLETTLVCYAPGAAQGRSVTGVERPSQVALSRDGGRIAWSLATPGEQNPVFSTAELTDGAVSAVERRRGRADQPDDAFTGSDVQDLAWSDDGHLVVSLSAQSDDGTGPIHVDLTAPAGRGWLEEAPVVPVPDADRGYRILDSVRSAEGDTALGNQRGSETGEDPPPDRAVQVDLESGQIVRLVATVAEGRYLVGVSGTPDAVVYVTAAGGADVKAYLRLAGEDRGTPISGLAADTEDVVAGR